jgi:hypothetical protein
MKLILSIIVNSLFLFNMCYAQCPALPGVSCNGSGASLDLYWVGTTASNNTGNWNTPCSWRVGSVSGVEPCQAPRSIDNVFFTANSFAGSSGLGTIITLNTIALCNNFYVDPLISALTTAPTFQLSGAGLLEVYGSLTFQTKMSWNTTGGPSAGVVATGPEVHFKATTPGKTIKTAGKFIASIVFDGIGGGWSLQDNLNAGNFLFRFGTFNTSNGGASFNMNLHNFASKVLTGGTAVNRVLNFYNSTINMSGISPNRYPEYANGNPTWEATYSVASNTTLNPGNSKIIFPATNLFTRLGGLNYNIIKHTGNGQFYDHFGNAGSTIDTLETNGYVYFYNTHIMNVLKINSVGEQHDFWYPQTVLTDFIIAGNLCNPTILNSNNNQLLTLPSTPISADPMIGYEIKNLRVTPNHSVTGTGNGTTTGWIISPPAPRNLYWVGSTSTTWGTSINWSTSATGAPLLTSSDCAPTSTDNVFFNTPIMVRACIVTADAKCKNMTWNVTPAATAAFTINGGNTMDVYGNLQLDADMTLTNNSSWYMRGASGNTLLSATKNIGAIQFSNFSDYTLLDDLLFTTKHFFYSTAFNSGGFNITGSYIIFEAYYATNNYSGSTITLSSSVPWYLYGSQGTMVYSATTQLNLTNTSQYTLIYGWGNNITWPNTTVQSSATTLRLMEYFGGIYNTNFTVNGNLTLNGGARIYADWSAYYPSSNVGKLVINGNLNLGAGNLYEFGLNTPNGLTVNGTINSVGTCSNPITIQGVNSNAFNFTVTGSKNFDYTNIGNANALGAIAVTNCVDIGGNTNVTFGALPATTTYYWRASAGACTPCVYSADWATGNNWTTNPLATQGTAGCMPGANDDVVFDNLSHNGTPSTITIAGTVSFNTINVTTTLANSIVFSGTALANMICRGNVVSNGKATFTSYLGTFKFAANTTGKTIRFGGINLGGNVEFVNPNGGYTLQTFLTTVADVNLNAGTLNTAGFQFNMRRFKSSGTSARTLNLNNSIMNINGGGTPGTSYLGDGTDVLTWDTQDPTNFNFNAGTSTVNISSGAYPIIKGNNLNFYKFNCTNTSSNIATSPVFLIDGWNTRYLKLLGSARMYGNNRYDTLYLTPSNIYKFENAKIQTLNAPNGILYATGGAGSEIAIKAINTGGTPAQFRKLNTGGSLVSYCFDYLNVEDNIATSDDPIFKFFVLENGNNISGTGIWDFSRTAFVTPTITASPATINVCPGNTASINFAITGQGPYFINYKINGGANIPVVLPFGATTFTLPNVSNYTTTTYTISSFGADYCSSVLPGTILGATVTYTVTPPDVISVHADVATCNLNNENQFVHFYKDVAPRRPLISIADATAGNGLGAVTATVQIDATVQTLGSGAFVVPYLQRRFGITPTRPQLSTIRLYFTQAELNALSAQNVIMGRPPVALTDLMVTKFNNNVMDFTGGATLLTVTNRGAIPAGITTSSNVFFVEVQVSSYSHFVIHPPTISPLPIELLSFTSKCISNTSVKLHWKTATETNNNYFNVEKSNNGVDWESIVKVMGAGNSSKHLMYSYEDKNSVTKEQYYRLKQTDFDGKYTYSDMLSVNCNDAKNFLSIYPNPSNGKFIINVPESNCNYELYSSTGQLLEAKALINGQNVITVNSYSNAMYYIVIKNEIEILHKDILTIFE